MTPDPTGGMKHLRKHQNYAAPTDIVQAAGAVCWRETSQGLEVLLVHRPKYDDWSWPKGVAHDAEPLPVTAIREVQEETGLRIALGVPLSSSAYDLPNGRRKVVAYWAAHLPEADLPRPPRPREVDRTQWCSPAQAEQLLTRRPDRTQLRELLALHVSGQLHTRAAVFMRHGYAYPRRNWTGKELARPLVGAGKRQSKAFIQLLACWAPKRIYCSPAERCLSTVAPFAQVAKVPVRVKKRLAEDRYYQDPRSTLELVTKMVAKGRPLVICTHRPAMASMVEFLRSRSSKAVQLQLPQSDPWLDPGESLVAHLQVNTGAVVAVEQHRAAHLAPAS